LTILFFKFTFVAKIEFLQSNGLKRIRINPRKKVPAKKRESAADFADPDFGQAKKNRSAEAERFFG
jgi:hypothetical protein